MIEGSLSEPHISGLFGAGCYGVSHNRTSINRQFWPPGSNFICTCPHHTHSVFRSKNGCHSWMFQIFPAVRFIAISIISNEMPAMPAIGNASDYYSCTVYALQSTAIGCKHSVSHWGRDTLQRGWLKHDNGCKLPSCAGIAGIRCHVSMLLEWQPNIMCCRPWLQSLAAYIITCWQKFDATASACAMLTP